MTPALLPDNLSRTKTARQYGQAYGCAPALLLAELTQQLLGQKSSRPLLAITNTVAEAEALIRQLQYFLGNNNDAALLSDLSLIHISEPTRPY